MRGKKHTLGAMFISDRPTRARAPEYPEMEPVDSTEMKMMKFMRWARGMRPASL